MPSIGSLANGSGGEGDTNASVPDFAFLPQELTAQCRSLIERHHRIHGYSFLPDMLWHADSRRIIQNHRELRRIFKKASMARSVRQMNDSLLVVATVILALEALVRNFAAWGAQFPGARQRAEKLLGTPSSTQRVWLLDAYLYTPHGLDRDSVLRLAPRADGGRQI